MRTIVDHIFELAQNSIKAGAKKIAVSVNDDPESDTLTVRVHDDGAGMSQSVVKRITETFFSTKPKRKGHVGLGLSLLDAGCKQAGGGLHIESKRGSYTTVTATMRSSHIDRPPLGDLADTYTSLILSSAENKVLWTLEHFIGGSGYSIGNRHLLDELGLLSFGERDARGLVLEAFERLEKGLARTQARAP